jgi:hypothetical protein
LAARTASWSSASAERPRRRRDLPAEDRLHQAGATMPVAPCRAGRKVGKTRAFHLRTRLAAGRVERNRTGSIEILAFEACRHAGSVASSPHGSIGGARMDNLSFGLTMTVVGVSGTFLTLWVLSLVVDLLKKVFPLRAQDEGEKKA